MRQFIIGNSESLIDTGTVRSYSPDENNGKIGFGYYKDGVARFDKGGNITDKGFICVIRDFNNGGNLIIPIYKNHFSYTMGEYTNATAFNANITIPEPSNDALTYTITAVKKGVKFNERNKWTATVPVKIDDTAKDIAAKILKYFMDGETPRYGIEVYTDEAGTKLIFGGMAGEDWVIIPADALYGTKVNVTSHGAPAYGDAKYIKDLADKAAADAGFEYTYVDPSHLLYPNYPLNPLKSIKSTDIGFVIFTLRFAEPREVKTVDDVIHQIVQIAFPIDSEAINSFRETCDILSGKGFGEPIMDNPVDVA